jgi:hypothetical protein
MGKLTQSTPEIQRILNEADGIREFVAETVGNISVSAEPMVSVTYDELVNLRNNGELIAGMQYRIIDYVTTTVQEYTESAGHRFDIIVTADNENTLNEVARACLHEGDTYFSNASAKLEAWQIWYSLDNDAERFAWADAENGKGVIYRMIDEWNNDCPYDFKNIIYVFIKSFMYNQWGRDCQFVRDSSLDKVIDGTQYYGYSSATPPQAWNEGKCWVTDENVTPETQLYKADGSVISYDGTIYNISNETSESYTFNEGALNDFSLEGEYCYGNTILAWDGGLNKIVFKTDKTYQYQDQHMYNCCSNSFGTNCHSNSFGTNCGYNSFGNSCYSNSFGTNCHSNSFGNSCSYNSFGNSCEYNSFGNDCSYNSFGTNCGYNSFGNSCHSNSFGNSCHSNSFGNNCSSNSFGDDYYSNSFGNNCSSNSFGNNCGYNSFGNDCDSNSFGNDCDSNSFDNTCASNSLGNNCNNNSFGNNCCSNRFSSGGGNLASYCSWNTFGNGVNSVSTYNVETASSNNQIQFYRFASVSKNYTIDVTRNNRCETYVGLNSAANIKILCIADLVTE